MRSLLLTAAAVVTIVSWPCTLDAQPKRKLRAVALYGQPDDALVLQLEGELRAMGYDVVLMERRRKLTRRDLDSVAARQAFDAAIDVPGTGEATTVWIVTDADPRRVQGPRPSGGSDTRITALRVIETLRVAWRSPAPRAGKIRKPRPTTEDPEPDTEPGLPAKPSQGGLRPLELALTPSLMWSPGGLSPWVGLDLHLAYNLASPTGIRLLTWLGAPLYALRIDDRSGAVDVLMGRASVGLGYSIELAQRSWSVPVALGVGAGWTWFSGRAEAPNQGRRGLIMTPLVEARAAICYAIGARWSLQGGMHAALVVPSHRIIAAERELVRWGQPSLGVSVGVIWGMGSRKPDPVGTAGGTSLPR